jgi:hypothetical protein
VIKIPPEGLRGQRLVEAAAGELRARFDIVRAAVSATLGRDWVDIDAWYAERVVVRGERGRLVAYPYAIAEDNTVQLGAPEEVVVRHAAVRVVEAVDVGRLIEAAAGATGEWIIRVICAGESSNGNVYPAEVLREAAPMFEGVRVFVKSDEEHLKDRGKDVRNLIGGLTAPRFIEASVGAPAQIQATLRLIEPEGVIAVRLREAHSRGLSGLFGFSIDSYCDAKTIRRGQQRLREARKFKKVNSVDLIVEPGAGGELIRMVEAKQQTQEQDTMRTRMIEAIRAKRPDLAADIDDDTPDEVVLARHAEATAPAAASGITAEQLSEQVRMVECRATARATIADSKLPQPAKEKLLADFSGRARFVEADVSAAIEAETQYLGRFTESGKPVIPFGAVDVEDRSVVIADMLDAFFDRDHKEHRNVQSFKECYYQITGDRRVTGRLEDCDMSRLREAAGASTRFVESVSTTTFANALGDSMRRALVRMYEGDTELQVWRNIVDVVPRFDFRSNELARIGGYGNLPAVGQGAGYASLTTPSDEKASYAVTKRGGLEDVTLEAIRNDDVAALRRIPDELALAAAQTLYEFVFDFIRTNPTIYDSVALFHASHGNLGTTALDATSVAAARLAMVNQTRAGSGKKINTGPAYALVPFELQEAAWNLFVRGTNLDKTYVQSLNPVVIPINYWTDANDWAMVANPRKCPTIEIGFLDGNETPDIFVQDMPNVGSMFSNDKLTYKIRHIYGGTVVDFRGMRKHVVA